MTLGSDNEITLKANSFEVDVEEQADRITKENEFSNGFIASRRNLCFLKTYTIDPVDSMEIDDAISLENHNSGYKVWIHIADPTAFFELNSPIDKEARRRSSTIYLAEHTIPMIPIRISSRLISLCQNKKCPAISVGVLLSDYGEVISFEITRSIIKPRYCLTYDDAEELIELAPHEEEDLYKLSKILDKRRSWREKRGAITLEQPQGRFTVKDSKPQLTVIYPSRSRRLISEAMILMGSVIGEFGSSNDLPLPYRSQLKSSIPSYNDLRYINNVAIRNSAIKLNLKKGYLGSRASHHFSLGLDAYVQFTSPLRRYSDILAHRQIINFTNERKTLTYEQLQCLIEEIDTAQHQAITITRENQYKWLKIWFSNNRDCTWNGYFLRWFKYDEGIALLYLDELAMDIQTKIIFDQDPVFGQKLKVNVQNIEPLVHKIQLANINS